MNLIKRGYHETSTVLVSPDGYYSTAHGIEQCDPLDTIDGGLLPFRDFYSTLTYLSDDEVIYTAVDPDQLTELQQDYFVKLLK